MSQTIIISITYPKIYEFDGWTFEYHRTKPIQTTTITNELRRNILQHITIARNALKVLHAKDGSALELITINQEVSCLGEITKELGEN